MGTLKLVQERKRSFEPYVMKQDKAAYKFWNSRKVISEFGNKPIDEYWKSVLEEIDNRDSKNVLDLGCGAGRNTEIAIKLGFKTYACDLNDGMVEAAKNRIKSSFVDFNIGNITKADMRSLPYSSDFFDVIIANGIYHNVTTKESLILALNETVRVLKKDGLLLLNMFTADSVDTSSLTESPKKPVYISNDNLKMVLLISEKILNFLNKLGLKPVKDIQKYNRSINTGERSVLRTVLKKNE